MGKKVILSIDVDMINYIDRGKTFYNELKVFYPHFKKNVLEIFPVKTSWFLRIDSQMESVFGTPDFCLKKNTEIIDELKKNDHEIGWHHHAYKYENENWLQETNEAKIINELLVYGKIARQYKLNVCRMGWGFQTNATMKVLSDLGFRIDSSGIPRPKYKWDLSVMDWEGALTHPYYPSALNYKQSGDDSLPILEAPLTTSYLRAAYDTEDVVRYVNPCYHHNKFKESFNTIRNKDSICMIMHPYESMPYTTSHDLISFSFEDLKSNIEFLLMENYEFICFEDLMHSGSV